MYNGSMSVDPVVSPWIVFPLGAVALVCVAAHLVVLRECAPDAMPESRRRIRLASGWVMLTLVPALSWGFGLVSPGDAALFAALWSLNIVLLGLVVALAMLDALNTLRLAHKRRRELGRDLARDIARAYASDG